ncbi:hypothetical protein BC834DRAFT_794681, partial [Gloeopeniophorella convolvens]
QGLDLARDTPVEILHVVLLGVAKYFWRDAVSRLDSAGKSLLKTRLTSLEVLDLGISPVRGHTLVQYARSLTGRDFRIILQVAPAVLYGLLPAPAWKAWMALCRVAPLIFQPRIESIDEYITNIRACINDFLVATALWSVRWFNKPKFHILLHLPAHVTRFGPPLLTATEGFESFNHVIRLRSIHSNRQAPSKDIGRAMNFMHATRHLVSGGVVFEKEGDTSSRRRAGPGVLELANDEEFSRFLGIQQVHERANASSQHFNSTCLTTRAVQCIRSHNVSLSQNPVSHKSQLVLTTVSYRAFQLINKDAARVGSFVMHIKGSKTRLARVIEILGTEDMPLFVVVQEWDVLDEDVKYLMPAVAPSSSPHSYHLAKAEDVLCTAHTFHNCSKHSCKPERTRRVRQEREDTGMLEDEVTHATDPDDRVLNLAQMHSAQVLHAFR